MDREEALRACNGDNWAHRKQAAEILAVFSDDEAAASLGHLLLDRRDTGVIERTARLLVARNDKFAADLLFGALALAEEEQGWFIFNAILTGLQSEDFDIDSHLTSSRGSENPWVRFGVEATLDWLDSLGYRPPFRSGS